MMTRMIMNICWQHKTSPTSSSTHDPKRKHRKIQAPIERFRGINPSIKLENVLGLPPTPSTHAVVCDIE